MTEDKIKEASEAKFLFDREQYCFTAGAQWALQQPKEPELNQQELCFDIACKMESNITFSYTNLDGSQRFINGYEVEAALRIIIEEMGLKFVKA